MASNFTLGSGTFTVASGGILNANTYVLSGAGSFTLASGGEIQSGSPAGITALGTASGNIQTTVARSYNTGANYTYNGSVAQVTGTGMPATVNNLTISNSAGVALTASVTVNGTFSPNSGVLTTTAAKLLTLSSTASSGSGSATSYVDGPMTKIGNSAFVFPIGNNGVWARLGITAPPTAANHLTAQYFNSPYANTVTVNAPLETVSQIEYWTLGETVAGDAVNITLYWQNNVNSYINTYDNSLRVAHWNGASWDDEGQSGISGGAAGNVTSNAVSSFSPFTFGSTNMGLNPLPISLTSFGATCNNYAALLQWATATEDNNDHFTVERTQDGIHYETVAEVKGAGNSTTAREYSTVDNSPLQGISYYRLSQTDIDGTTTHVGTVVYTPCESAVTFNAFCTSSFMNIQINATATDVYTITLMDDLGRIILSQTRNIVPGLNIFKIPVQSSDNMYILRVAGKDNVYTKKLLQAGTSK